MEQNKYYTPDLEDLYVGWEGEACFSSYGGYYIWDFKNPEKDEFHPPEDKEKAKFWSKFNIVAEENFGGIGGRNIETAIMCLKDKRLRCKFLDKEDIESFGWEYREDAFHRKIIEDKGEVYIPTHYWFIRENSNITLTWYPNQYLLLQEENPTFMLPSVKYKGECKSINELRKIMQMLKIEIKK